MNGAADPNGAPSPPASRAAGALGGLGLDRLPGVEARPQALLAPFTTFRIGGPADLLLIPHTREGLEAAVKAVRRLGLALLPIGAGSNLLVAEAGFRGVALKIGSGLGPVRIVGERLTADSGRTLPELMRRARRAGLSGLEFAGGIPGSLGGSLRMNAGAWNRDMAGIAERIVGVNGAAETVEIGAREVAWSYREARFPEPMIILEASLRLASDDSSSIAEREETWHAARRQTQPLGEPSAGCVFKNPPGDHASRLVEASGMKGERLGGALVSAVHANFIINAGGATAADVLGLIDRVRARVLVEHGVDLELELEVVGMGDRHLGGGGARNG